MPQNLVKREKGDVNHKLQLSIVQLVYVMNEIDENFKHYFYTLW